jgi:hypothetical protein
MPIEDDRLTSTKFPVFLGEDEKWRQWAWSTQGVRRKYGWWEELETEHTIDRTKTGEADLATHISESESDYMESSLHITSGSLTNFFIENPGHIFGHASKEF